ncbi:MAG TPA: LysR family transcriptional regulator [Candidatus Blautia faecipullorum]|nr:LysR family transcriptional regulator [Candidatus Blautia faecipullorum]
MELRVLRYFLAVAREQNILRAAESLHLSQPTLSTQIRQLEEELGKQLLIRGTKGSRKIVLTDEGMILRRRAEEILDLVEKTQTEIALSDSVIIGDVYIGAGETDAVRLLARAARELQSVHPGIHYHISSGNAEFVIEQLDKGLIDFGVIFGDADLKKYNALKIPVKDTWGVLMRRDSFLAAKKAVTPEDLLPLPLILSHQVNQQSQFSAWLNCDMEKLNVVATYNLLFNASILVDEGLGYAVGLDKIIYAGENSSLCFRPLAPGVEAEMNIVWKKYQLLSKASEQYLKKLKALV